MLTNERQAKILEILKQTNTVKVETLASALFVSDATVRRDLKEMQSMGLLVRSHGGAFLSETTEEVSMFFRIQKNAREKERVATVAINRLPEFRSVFIDSSSTALALADRIDLAFKTVVTNNLQTAMQVSKKPNVNLILLGGAVQYNTVASTGCWTAKQLEEFSFDLAIVSCAGITPFGAFERSLDQREIKRTALFRSKHKILLVDHTKFDSDCTHFLSALSAFDFVATDEKPSAEYFADGVEIVY